MRQITVGIIGCGRICNNAHVPALLSVKDVRVKYACDLIYAKAEAVKNKLGAEKACTDYNQVIGDKQVDCVFVLTPNFAHYEITMAALKAGKHVFCEKPITVNYALSREMCEEADRQGKILNIGVCNRYHKSVELLEKLNREGKFGKIYHVYCSYRKYRCIPGLGGAFTTNSQSGGGVLIDWGVHFFDLIYYILGGAKTISATADAYSEMAKDMKAYKCNDMWARDTADVENGINDVEDFISGYIRTDKASVSFNGAWAQNIGHDEMYIDFLGDKAGARLDYCGHFTLWSQDESGELAKTVYDYPIPDMYTREDEAFFESVRSGKKCRSNISDVLPSAQLLEMLYESAGIKKELYSEDEK